MPASFANFAPVLEEGEDDEEHAGSKLGPELGPQEGTPQGGHLPAPGGAEDWLNHRSLQTDVRNFVQGKVVMSIGDLPSLSAAREKTLDKSRRCFVKGVDPAVGDEGADAMSWGLARRKDWEGTKAKKTFRQCIAHAKKPMEGSGSEDELEQVLPDFEQEPAEELGNDREVGATATTGCLPDVRRPAFMRGRDEDGADLLADLLQKHSDAGDSDPGLDDLSEEEEDADAYASEASSMSSSGLSSGTFTLEA